MKLRWLGHACFLIVSSQGTRIVTDPYDETVGYSIPSLETDYVTVSHDHFDHNAVKALSGQVKVVRTAGKHQLGDVAAMGTSTFHDQVSGAKRGPNVVFVLEVDGIRVCHLGDLGHIPSTEQVSSIGKVDVLLIPVGGTYTIDAAAAATVTAMLDPKIVIPMHFRTRALSFPLDSVESYLEKVGGGTRTGRTTLDIGLSDLRGPRRVYVLEYV